MTRITTNKIIFQLLHLKFRLSCILELTLPQKRMTSFCFRRLLSISFSQLVLDHKVELSL